MGGRMEIAFFSEGPWQGRISRDYKDMRTDMAWYVALNADHYNIHSGNIDKEYDLGIVIIPKKNPQFNLNRIKNQCKQIASMQEGPHWYWQDYPLEQQIWFYNILQEMNFLFVHNNIDKKYYEGLTSKDCYIMPSLMIEDSIKDLPETERSGVMIGGNFCQWYGGFDSYITAQEFDTDIFVPSMGRKINGEESIPDLNHLPYVNWTQWIYELNKRKYAVHLMRTHAAGTFALNCAYLGIPCIGYKGLDTQEVCHPDTTIELGDITKAKQIAEKLRKDEDFYLYCSKFSKLMYKEKYHESVFRKNFNEYEKNKV